MTIEPGNKKSDIMLLKNYFGVREGQTLTDFAQELKSLSDEEKAELAQGIRDETFDY